MIDLQLLKDLNAFNRVIYKDIPHDYILNGEKLLSVTTILHEFEPEFNSLVEAQSCVERHTDKFEMYHGKKSQAELDARPEWQKHATRYANREVDEIVAEWDLTNRMATTMGSIVHACAEQLWQNRILPDFQVDIDLDLIKDKVAIGKKLLWQFYKKYNTSRYLSVAPEFVMFDEELKLSGMIDFLCYDVVDQCFCIIDWKTNKKIDKTGFNGKRMLGIFGHLESCEFNTYSLQLSVYKTILERNTSIKIEKLLVVHFDTINEQVVEYPIPYMETEVNALFSLRKERLLEMV